MVTASGPQPTTERHRRRYLIAATLDPRAGRTVPVQVLIREGNGLWRNLSVGRPGAPPQPPRPSC